VTLSRHSRIGAAAIVGVLALALTSCSSSSGSSSSSGAPSSTLKGELNGAGSSAQESAMAAWRAGFQSLNSGATVNYDSVGSGGGRTQFLAGGVAFAGTDAALSTDELAKAKTLCGTDPVELPVYISPIVVIFNVPGITKLQMAPATIAKIFDAKITNWNDPAIAADNPGVTLPDLAITTVHRSDDSGTTKNFTDYLSKTAADSWSYGAVSTWAPTTGEGANGTTGVVSTVQSGSGAIGYADASKAGSLGTVAIKVGSAYVPFSADAAAKVADVSPRDTTRASSDIVIKLDRTTTDATAYPLVLVSYVVACPKYSDPKVAPLVHGFLAYIVSEAGQNAAASAAGSAPLSAALRVDAAKVVDTIGAS
jgi:phosphate transport system substrate-binding protein